MKDTTKAGAIVAVTYNHDGTLTFGVRGFAPLQFNPAKASLECRARAQALGWKNRIGDGAAVSADPATGKTDPAAKYAAVQALIQHYESGTAEWSRKASAAPRDDTGLVLMALMRVRKLDVDGANALIEKMMAKAELDRKAVIANVAKNPDVIRAIGEIKAERAAETTMAADLLAEMDDESENESDEA